MRHHHLHHGVPDSHNARSFLSRWLAPSRWEPGLWAALLLLFFAAGASLAVQLFEMARRPDARLITVHMKIAGLTVTPATDGRHPTPRSVVVKPEAGELYFQLSDPPDRLVEAKLGAPASFGYFPGDCELHSAAEDPKAFRRVCRPFAATVDGQVVLDVASSRAKALSSAGWSALLLLAVVGVATFLFRLSPAEKSALLDRADDAVDGVLDRLPPRR